MSARRPPAHYTRKAVALYAAAWAAIVLAVGICLLRWTALELAARFDGVSLLSLLLALLGWGLGILGDREMERDSDGNDGSDS